MKEKLKDYASIEDFALAVARKKEKVDSLRAGIKNKDLLKVVENVDMLIPICDENELYSYTKL